jgi:hypothetical protein
MLVLSLVISGCVATNTANTAHDGPKQVLSKGEDFHVSENHGRHYVVGSTESLAKFMASGHLPYTKTILGAGPMGETVVFEVNKKDPSLAERLQKEYNHTPFLIKSNNKDFFIYKKGERHYVVGSQASSDKFLASGHLPYTKTILGAGPMGETVIFEVDKKNASVADRLVKTYM